MVTQEFQAIVLAAGRGSRLSELLGGGDTPKCLLPVGPYPLLWYPLHTLEQHNFTEAIVIVLDNELRDVQQQMDRLPLKIKLIFATIPSEGDYGTADSLRLIHERIVSDFIVLTCDLITNASLYPLINNFRQHNASVAALFFSAGNVESGVTLPGPRTKHKPERDLIGIKEQTQRLLFLASISDYDEVVSVNAHLMRKNGEMTIYSRLMDGHVYVLKRWIIDFLRKVEHISTLKGEFLPYIIKKQMAKYNSAIGEVILPDARSESCAANLGKKGDDLQQHFALSNYDHKVAKTSQVNDSLNKDPYQDDLMRCYAVQAPKEAIGVRVNTSLSFYAINQKIQALWSDLLSDAATHPLISPEASVNSTQTKDLAVSENAKLSEKTSLQHSVFASSCLVQPKNIISNSVLMSLAVVEEGCNIESCIVGYKAIVKKGCVLKNCLIGPGYVVEEGTRKQGVHLTNADGFMEIDIQ